MFKKLNESNITQNVTVTNMLLDIKNIYILFNLNLFVTCV